MEHKFCRKCQEWKPTDQFYKRNRGGCIKCIRAYQAKYYLEHYAAPIPEPLPQGLKKCGRCKEVKPVNEFYRDKSEKDGYHHHCKDCSDEIKRKRLGYTKTSKTMSPKGYRKCSRCKVVKSDNDFKSKTSANCIECVSLRKQELDNVRATAKKRRAAYIAEWRKNPYYQAKQEAYRVGYNQRKEVKERGKKANAVYRARPESQEKARRKTIEWRKANPELARHQAAVRNARIRNAEGFHTFDQWLILLTFFDCCPGCKQVKQLTCDHIIPLSKGGTNYIDNLQPLCLKCNVSKNAHQIIDYRPAHVRQWAHQEVISLGA